MFKKGNVLKTTATKCAPVSPFVIISGQETTHHPAFFPSLPNDPSFMAPN